MAGLTVSVDTATEYVGVAQIGARLDTIDRELRHVRSQLRVPDADGAAVREQEAALKAERETLLERMRAERDALEAERPDTAPILQAPRLLSAVPPRFADALFTTYVPRHAAQTAPLAAMTAFVDRVRAGRAPMLALIGPQGTGKSHLLYAAARALASAGAKVYVRPWYRLADELRYGGRDPFNEGAGKLEPSEVRDKLWGQRVVLIDEVRPTAGTAFDDTELTKFACHAYDQQIAACITTNVNPLADVMGPPAASRFTQLVLDGPDHRQTPPTDAEADAARPARRSA